MKVIPLKPSAIPFESASPNARQLPLYASGVSAGFPSPADDYIEGSINLHEQLVKHPASTFFARANGHSMKHQGIFDGDLLVIDRAVNPFSGAVVIAAINGEMVCKILDKERKQLLAANPQYSPINLSDDIDCLIEGVVTHSVRHHYFKG